jgi:hypothetical protein
LIKVLVRFRRIIQLVIRLAGGKSCASAGAWLLLRRGVLVFGVLLDLVEFLFGAVAVLLAVFTCDVRHSGVAGQLMNLYRFWTRWTGRYSLMTHLRLAQISGEEDVVDNGVHSSLVILSLPLCVRSWRSMAGLLREATAKHAESVRSVKLWRKPSTDLPRVVGCLTK